VVGDLDPRASTEAPAFGPATFEQPCSRSPVRCCCTRDSEDERSLASRALQFVDELRQLRPAYGHPAVMPAAAPSFSDPAARSAVQLVRPRRLCDQAAAASATTVSRCCQVRRRGRAEARRRGGVPGRSRRSRSCPRGSRCGGSCSLRRDTGISDGARRRRSSEKHGGRFPSRFYLMPVPAEAAAAGDRADPCRSCRSFARAQPPGPRRRCTASARLDGRFCSGGPGVLRPRHRRGCAQAGERSRRDAGRARHRSRTQVERAPTRGLRALTQSCSCS
jgi:hypothetical protein